MKIIDLLQTQTAYQGLVGQKLPTKVAYAIYKNLRLINEELKAFGEDRDKIYEDHGWAINPETGKFDLTKDQEAERMKLVDELLDTELELHPTVTIAFSQIENLDLTPAEIAAIDFMLTDKP